MTATIDHDTCSSRLRAYVAGELHSDAAAEVEAHLEMCEHCSAERRAVDYLAHAPTEAMTADERGRLHAAVASRRAQESAARVIPLGGWRARLAPALAAAALVALVAVAGANLLTGGKGSSVGGAGGTGEAAESGRASPARRDDAGKRVPKSNQSLQLSSAKPRFDAAAGPVSAEGLRRLGRTGLQFQAAAATYTPAEADRLAEPFTSELVTAAPADLTDQLRDCIDEVLAKDASLLPVYAAEGELDGRPVLITGFARSPDGSERLDHYEVWAWPQGSCAAPLSVGSGRIAP